MKIIKTNKNVRDCFDVTKGVTDHYGSSDSKLSQQIIRDIISISQFDYAEIARFTGLSVLQIKALATGAMQLVDRKTWVLLLRLYHATTCHYLRELAQQRQAARERYRRRAVLRQDDVLSKRQSYHLKTQYRDVQFTQREIDCLRYLCQGHTVAQTAEQLVLSPRTVEFYVNNMKVKVGVKSKQSLLRIVENSAVLQEAYE